MRCLRCRSPKLVEIDMTVGGIPLSMHSCLRCETRWWEQDGRRLPLDEVLALARAAQASPRRVAEAVQPEERTAAT